MRFSKFLKIFLREPPAARHCQLQFRTLTAWFTVEGTSGLADRGRARHWLRLCSAPIGPLSAAPFRDATPRRSGRSSRRGMGRQERAQEHGAQSRSVETISPI